MFFGIIFMTCFYSPKLYCAFILSFVKFFIGTETEGIMADETEFGPDIFTLVDEDGVEHEFELLDAVELEDGRRYIALYPIFENPEEFVESDGELVILREDSADGEEAFVHIEDEDEFNNLAEIFMERLSDEFDFLDDDDSKIN